MERDKWCKNKRQRNCACRKACSTRFFTANVAAIIFQRSVKIIVMIGKRKPNWNWTTKIY